MFLKNNVYWTALLFFIISYQVAPGSAQCRIRVKQDLAKEDTPMIVKLRKASFEYPMAEDPSIVEVSLGDRIRVFCPGKTNLKSNAITRTGVVELNGKDGKGGKKKFGNLVELSCVGKDKFQIANINDDIDFTQLSCEKIIGGTSALLLKDPANGKCGQANKYNIGYDLGGAGFLKTIDLCHDENEAKTLWAHSVIQLADRVENRFTGNKRSSFRQGSLYNGIPSEFYTISSVYKTFQQILGVNVVDKYLDELPNQPGRRFLARGHLIANADKLYKAGQDSTYFYANTVPMWQVVNANPGNWFFVEEYVRKLAYTNGHDLDVWAGSLGQLELEGQSLNLVVNPVPKALRVPVPLLTYKCVVDEIDAKALCFVVVNNPYLDQHQFIRNKRKLVVCDEHLPCRDINPFYNKFDRGYMYCCSLADFVNNNRDELALEDQVRPYLDYPELDLNLRDPNVLIHSTVRT